MGRWSCGREPPAAFGIMATYASVHSVGQCPSVSIRFMRRATATAQGGGSDRHTEMGIPAIPGEVPSRIDRRASRTRSASQGVQGQASRGKCCPKSDAMNAAQHASSSKAAC